MIQIYYGFGKGKTTAAIGQALRACGAGKSACVYAFLKDNSSSERLARCDVEFYPTPQKLPFLFKMSDEEKAEYAAFAQKMLADALSSDYDVIVLDEFLDAVSLFDFDYIKLLSFSPDKEYVITGHTEIAPLFEKADYITEFKKIRHPFDNGASARQGIEF